MDFAWTPQQAAVLEEYRTGSGHIVLDARAGSAKTTTNLAGIELAPERRILATAFSRDIATELSARMPNPNADARTCHSLGNAVLRRVLGKLTLDKNRGYRLAKAALGAVGRGNDKEAIRNVRLLASLGKAAMIAEAPWFIRTALRRMMVDSHEAAQELAAATIAAIEMSRDLKDKTIDFDDMMYLPVVNGWVMPQFDLVMIDEVQDMSPVQLQMARRACVGRIITAGDPFQMIYGFRGAQGDGMETFARDLNAKLMGLTVSFRCPHAIGDLVQQLVPDFEIADGNAQGTLTTENVLDPEWARDIKPGDFVLSRTNAPLFKVYKQLIARRIPVNIRGRGTLDILTRMIDRQRADSIKELLSKLDTWVAKRVAFLEPHDFDGSGAAEVRDNHAIIKILAADADTVSQLKNRLDAAFNDTTQGAVICSTVHRAKGLEADRVYVLTDTLFSKRGEPQEERNIAYVAYTRAKRDLVLLKGDLMKSREGDV